jgi:predicted nucleotide-binding protein
VMDVGKFGSFPMGAGEEYWENHRAESLQSQVTAIDSLIELLETELSLQSSAHTATTSEVPVGNEIFLVHGHDEAVLQSAARFLEKLDLSVTILREKPNQGRTIIEKFMDYGEVGFAVILLTPDDRGGKISEPYEAQQPRARQNVILELVFFLGKIGRKRVCALYRQGVEIPSDYQGVAFVQLDDAGAWKLALAKEIKAAGIDVDMNKPASEGSKYKNLNN